MLQNADPGVTIHALIWNRTATTNTEFSLSMA